MRSWTLAGFFLLLGALVPAPTAAHPLDPALLELQEDRGGKWQVLWRVPATRPRDAPLEPILPPCERGDSAVSRQSERVSWRFELLCGQEGQAIEGLAGQQIGVQGLEARQSEVLVRVIFANGNTAQQVLRADAPFWIIPSSTPSQNQVTGPSGAQATSSPNAFRTFFDLGLRHILSGTDHLLFVLGLLFLVQGGRALFFTVTAFTLGHSITLSLAALGAIHLPSAPVEVAIAASIWVLAVTLCRRRPNHRFPEAMAVAFGLLHGLGFAGALIETGLPQGEIPMALFAFNVGIEAGQLLFVAAVLTLILLASRLSRQPVLQITQRLALPAAYVIGTLASFWILDRGWMWLR